MIETISIVLFKMLKNTYTNCSVSIRNLVYTSFYISSYYAFEYFEALFSAIIQGRRDYKYLPHSTIGINEVR